MFLFWLIRQHDGSAETARQPGVGARTGVHACMLSITCTLIHTSLPRDKHTCCNLLPAAPPARFKRSTVHIEDDPEEDRRASEVSAGGRLRNIWTDQRCCNERPKGMMEEMRGISTASVMWSRFRGEQSRTLCLGEGRPFG